MPSVEELYIGGVNVDDLGAEKSSFPNQSSPSTSHRIDASMPDSMPAFRCQEWLEVGLVEIGPFYVDVGSSVDHIRHDLPLLQNAFLKLHDTRTRRLWFLWNPLTDSSEGTTPWGAQPNPGSDLSKCGCRGGCAFFGQNANGYRFFEREAECPSAATAGGDPGVWYAALAHTQLRRGNDPAFAQSILQENAFLIDLDDGTETNDHISPSTLVSSSAGANGERSLSQNSNTSTVKNVTSFSGQAKAETTREEEEDDDDNQQTKRPIAIRKSRSSRISLQDMQQSDQMTQQANQERNEQFQRLGSATSTPTLLPTTKFASSAATGKRRGNSRVSMPLLVDGDLPSSGSSPTATVVASIASSTTNSIPGGRKHSNVSSRGSRSESQSEMYYSAEEDDDNNDDNNTSSNDELVSLSPSPSADGLTYYSGTNDAAASTSAEAINRTRTSTRNANSHGSSSSTLSSSSSSGRSSQTSRTSNISFNSAISSVDDFSLVDLHLQSARPVVDSPILLASYITHLGEAQCDNWKQSAPKFPADLRSNVSASRPRFVLVKPGFSSFRLVDRSPPSGTPGYQNRY